jgi:hypothetical protein
MASKSVVKAKIKRARWLSAPASRAGEHCKGYEGYTHWDREKSIRADFTD